MDTNKKPKLLPPKKRILEASFSESMEPQASTSSPGPMPPEIGNTLETSSVSRASQESPSHLLSSSMTDQIEKKEDQEDEWGFLEQLLEDKPNDSSLMIHQDDVLKKSQDDVKKKGVYIPPYILRRFNSETIDTTLSTEEDGEAYSRVCVICDVRKPAGETDLNVTCRHAFCPECIKDYVIKEIQEVGMPIKCPEKDCKHILTEAVLKCVPKEQLELWKISAHDAKVLAHPQVVSCPFVDCGLTFFDDQKDYPIKACPKCGSLYCTKCRLACHMGMDCPPQDYMNNNDYHPAEAEPYPFDLNFPQDYMDGDYYDPAEPYPFDFDWEAEEGGDWGGDDGGDWGGDDGDDWP